MVNAHWQDRMFTRPGGPPTGLASRRRYRAPSPDDFSETDRPLSGSKYLVTARSVVVLDQSPLRRTAGLLSVDRRATGSFKIDSRSSGLPLRFSPTLKRETYIMAAVAQW